MVETNPINPFEFSGLSRQVVGKLLEESPLAIQTILKGTKRLFSQVFHPDIRPGRASDYYVELMNSIDFLQSLSQQDLMILAQDFVSKKPKKQRSKQENVVKNTSGEMLKGLARLIGSLEYPLIQPVNESVMIRPINFLNPKSEAFLIQTQQDGRITVTPFQQIEYSQLKGFNLEKFNREVFPTLLSIPDLLQGTAEAYQPLQYRQLESLLNVYFSVYIKDNETIIFDELGKIIVGNQNLSKLQEITGNGIYSIRVEFAKTDQESPYKDIDGNNLIPKNYMLAKSFYQLLNEPIAESRYKILGSVSDEFVAQLKHNIDLTLKNPYSTIRISRRSLYDQVRLPASKLKGERFNLFVLNDDNVSKAEEHYSFNINSGHLLVTDGESIGIIGNIVPEIKLTNIV